MKYIFRIWFNSSSSPLNKLLRELLLYDKISLLQFYGEPFEISINIAIEIWFCVCIRVTYIERQKLESQIHRFSNTLDLG